jgi:HSP20 family molecular chaperone IbpA
VDQDNIEAHFENGVLSVTLPKAEAAKPKRIELKIN